MLKLSYWSKLWLLDFSVPKCKLVRYGNVKYQFECQMEDKNGTLHNLPSDSKEKDLDIVFENTIERLNLPTLYYRRKRYDLIQLFKIVHGYEDIKPEKFFEFNDNCTRGHIFKNQKKTREKSRECHNHKQ